MSYDQGEDAAEDVAIDAQVSGTARSRRRGPTRTASAHGRAFGRLYREHFGVVWSAVRRCGVPDAHQEDAVQEVWLVAYRRLDTLLPDASPQAWLCSIARRVASRLRRTEFRQRRKIAAIELASERPGDGVIEVHDARRVLGAVLGQLDDDQRDVLVLAQVHGLTGPEIAQTLEIPVNTAYSRLRLARRRVERFAAEAGVEQASVIGALRRREQPPSRAAARVWLVLVPKLGLSAGAAGSAGAAAGIGSGTAGMATTTGIVSTVVGGFTAAKAFAVTVVVGLLGLVAVEGVVDARPAAPSGVADDDVVADATADLRTAAPALVAPTAVAVDDAVAATPSLDEAVVGPEPTVLPPAAPPRAVARGAVDPSRSRPTRPPGARREAEPSGSDSVPPKAQPSSLPQEAALLGEAQRALRGGDPAQALQLLEQHERRFPQARLDDERKGARVRALCGLGRAAEARAEARRLLLRSPDSPVAAGVADVCQ
ncbi:MAG: sigma-70 family RNA polymerase sigma factor [Deltaproteobacteria bacterium]|nr:sigma-70 family RNA polymerase sigma factor [Deltaproteobacteria bacterium]